MPLGNSDCILSDTLWVLACEDIKLASLKARAEDDDAFDDDVNIQGKVNAAAKKQIITAVSRKTNCPFNKVSESYN